MPAPADGFDWSEAVCSVDQAMAKLGRSGEAMAKLAQSDEAVMKTLGPEMFRIWKAQRSKPAE